MPAREDVHFGLQGIALQGAQGEVELSTLRGVHVLVLMRHRH